jgi:hypothetical protein
MKKGSKFKRPSGIVSARVVVGTNPPEKPNSSTPSSKIQTHLFVKGTEPKKVSSVNYSIKPSTSSEKPGTTIEIIPGE